MNNLISFESIQGALHYEITAQFTLCHRKIIFSLKNLIQVILYKT